MTTQITGVTTNRLYRASTRPGIHAYSIALPSSSSCDNTTKLIVTVDKFIFSLQP